MKIKNLKAVCELTKSQRVKIIDQSFLVSHTYETVQQWNFDDDFPVCEEEKIMNLKISVMFFTSDNWLIIYAK